jgi:hypothetical protein
MKILLFAAIMAAVSFAAVWLNSVLRARTLQRRWEVCLSQASEILNRRKLEFPGCEGAMNMAITVEPDGRIATKDGDLAMEQYLDKLDQANPEETPFMASIGLRKRGAGDGVEVDLANSQLSWGVDKIQDPIGAVGWGDNYAIQTAEYVNVLENQRKMGNYAQAYRRATGVGWIADAVTNVPGGALSPRAQRRMDELLKQDIEVGCCSSDQIAVAASGSASFNGTIMAGFRKLIDTANKYTVGNFAYGKPTDLHFAPAAACLTTALATTFNYAAMRTIMRAMREASAMGSNFNFLCGLDVRDAVTNMVDPITQTAAAAGTSAVVALNGVRVFNRSQDDTTFGHSIGILKTDYGRVEVMESKRLGTTTTGATRDVRAFVEQPKNYMLYHPSDWHLHYGVRGQLGSIPDQGQGKQVFRRSLVALRVTNPIRSAFGVMT